MKLTKTKVTILIAIFAIMGITAGIVIYEQTNKPDVKLGYLTGDIHQLAFFIAEYKGYYEEEGLKVETYQFANGGAVMSAFEAATRSIDMAYLGFAPAVVHRFNTKGADITVLASVNVNGTSIIVKNDGSINSIADLKGKKIAIPTRNNMQDFILHMALDTEPSVSYEDLNTIIMSVPNMKLALESGSIDGYVAWEPYCAQAVEGNTPIGKYLANSSELWPNHPCCVVAAHNEFLNQHPDLVKKILKVHVRATNFINNPANYNEVVSIAVQQLGLSENVVKTALENVGYMYTPDLDKMIEFVQKLVYFGTVSMNSELLPQNINNETDFINYFVDTTLLDEIVA
ncbi:MAG: ABC transporter substrate-binding protein [Promethearchaeota archaeon]